MMADAKHLLEFLEGGIGMLFDLGLEFLRVEFAPVSPACFRGQRACFGGLQIPINGTPGQVKPPGGLGFGTARLDEVHHPFPQVQRISFHALKPITLCPNVNMKCYTPTPFGKCVLQRFQFFIFVLDDFGFDNEDDWVAASAAARVWWFPPGFRI